MYNVFIINVTLLPVDIPRECWCEVIPVLFFWRRENKASLPSLSLFRVSLRITNTQ